MRPNTSELLSQLVAHLTLEQLEENLYRGQSQDLGWGAVYGGQVVAQSLVAALQTVPAEREVHSLHAYFMRTGDVSRPIVYQVDRSRDGASFATRHVVAIQHGHPIFEMTSSFQKAETSFEHQVDMPKVAKPDDVPTEQERMRTYAGALPDFIRERLFAERPIEYRIVDENDPNEGSTNPPHRFIWLRTRGALPDQPFIHQAMLAYASDFGFLTTALKPHGVTWLNPTLQLASLDHAIWFHGPFRADAWLLHEMHSAWSGGARGFVTGRVFTADGRLVASTAQEGLLRRRTR